LISKFRHNWFAITHGVNAGGNGFIIASLANLIAFRIVKDRRFWIYFHRYSVPYFIITATILYVLLNSLNSNVQFLS